MRATWLLVFASLLPVAATAAEPQQMPAALTAVLTRPEHRADLLQAAHAVDPPGIPACKNATYTTTGQVGILDPIRTDASGKLIGGAWKEQVRESGCGMDRTLNALTAVGPDGSLEVVPLLPGSTITDPKLQQDSVQYAAAGLGGLPPGCEQGGVVDTRFIGVDGQPPGGLPAPGSTPQPWTEVWTVQACAKRAEVRMRFTPDGTGTDIRVIPPKQAP